MGYGYRGYPRCVPLCPDRSLQTRMSGLLLVLTAIACLLGTHAVSDRTPFSGGSRTNATASTSFSPPVAGPEQTQPGPDSSQLLTVIQADSIPVLIAAMGECATVIAVLGIVLLLPQRNPLAPPMPVNGIGSRRANPRPRAGPLLRACTVLQV